MAGYQKSVLRNQRTIFLMEVKMFKPPCIRRAFAASAILAAVLIAANAPAAAQRGWQSGQFGPPNGGLLTFTVIGGNPACASYDGRNCLWGRDVNQIRFGQVRPLVCGADHRDKWGSTGYEDRRHWCNLAKRMSRFDD